MSGRRTSFGFYTVIAALTVAVPQIEARAATATVIATGLVNPKGIDESPSGALYVAEAGNGGSDCSSIAGACFGLSGAVSRIDPTGVQPAVRIVTGLPSIYSGSPRVAVGANDVSFSRYGAPTIIMGLGGDPGVREKLGAAGANLGKLLRILGDNRTMAVADISAFEQANNPDRTTIDSNPYGIEAQPSEWAVADAGANTLLRARPNGKTSLLAVFAPVTVTNPLNGQTVTAQAVPTSVTRGPDGYWYVGTLTGFPFATGAASVWRVPPEGGKPELCASGFTTIADVAFDPYGRLYVLEISSGLRVPPVPPPPPLRTPGKLKRLDACGTAPVTVYDNSDPTQGVVLEYPAGVVIGLDGAAYVTNRTVDSGGGQVIRIALTD
ncbi:MAG TPA: ScyD/ScyE family protein [Steroidobacteraceae bacterium]|nr:ScyD/ScyE family protein [Steroidobacteraceae bacterium]